jgi:LysR family glycine cleavage system transcriptional activator
MRPWESVPAPAEGREGGRVAGGGRGQVELAVRHGKGVWPGIEATFLLQEIALPVCAPGFLRPDEEPLALLARARLIVNARFPDEWEEWARARGLAPPPLAGAIELESEQALQVAESGHGLALGRRPMVDERLARATLVAPFGAGDPTGAAYYLCRTPEAPRSVARQVEQWLQGLAAPPGT